MGIDKKTRKRLYFLKLLKNYGAPTKDLLAFYNSIIRPVLEYSDVLWSGGLTAKQRCNIERIQKRAFRVIYPGQDYEHVLKVNKLATLEERGKDHCLKQISGMTREHHKLNHLLPPKRSAVTERNTSKSKYELYL